MKKSLCVTALAIATGMLGSCTISQAEGNGYIKVSDDFVAKMPKEAITAVLNKVRYETSIQVDSPAACLKAARATQFGSNATCFKQDGSIALVVNYGTPFTVPKSP